MSTRTREWLQSFLNLGARAEKDSIPIKDVQRQEDTVIRALDMLDESPGIVLADEVGMGKTYEALGIAAATRHANRRSRIVVITPGPDLNKKWFDEFSHFKEMYDFGDLGDEPVGQLSDFVLAVQAKPVVVASVSMFQSGRGGGEQSHLLSLYFHWKQLHGHTANAIMARFRDGDHDRVNLSAEKFLGAFALDQLEPHLQAAFQRGRSGGVAGLDDLYEAGGLQAFENSDAVRSALYRARFVLTGKFMPTFDLLIVDEAHKLKNPGSLRTDAMRRVFHRRFKKALFLTATPFQLDVSELQEIFSLFGSAIRAPENLKVQIEELLTAVRDYQTQYDLFQRTWSSLDHTMAAEFRSLYDTGPDALKSIDAPSLQLVARQIAALKRLKAEAIEPGFRKWMIRSLREDKRVYRRHEPKNVCAQGVGVIPFLIYERFIAELFRRGRPTHKAAVEINMVSSFAAAQEGTILSSEAALPPEAESYRKLLCEVLKGVDHHHPKVADVVANALDAADRGEKTLIFCSRVASLEQLRRDLEAKWEARMLERWRLVYPGATDIFDTREGDEKRQRGRHALLQSRFHRPQDALYLALRESYLRTMTSLAEDALTHMPAIVEEANRILAGLKVGKTSAERLDYQIARRCVEQATARLIAARGAMLADEQDALSKLLNVDYVRFGLDLTHDEFDNESVGSETPQWQVTERVAGAVIGSSGSLWERHSSLLDDLEQPALRVRVVEQLARYLTYKQVPFLADLLAEAKANGLAVDPVESSALLEFMQRFWESRSGRRWLEQIGDFLRYFLRRDDRQRLEILDGPIKTGDFARHTREGESRERLREAFNTPLFPIILIANRPETLP